MSHLSRLASLSILALLPAATRAGQLDLTSTYGWSLTFPDQMQVTLNPAASSNLVLALDVVTDYTDAPYSFGGAPTLAITFFQGKRPATPQISIESETITNHSGTDWMGYQYYLAGPHETNQTSFVQDVSKTFAENPFPNSEYFVNYPDAATNVYYTGSTAAPGQTFTLGSNGRLLINAGPFTDDSGYPSYYSQIFALNSVPLLGSSPIAVPLPSSSLMILAGMGLGITASRWRRRV